MTVTRARVSSTRTSHLLEVQVETYKMQAGTWERLTSCIAGTKIQGQGNRGPRRQRVKSQRIKGPKEN